jgi:hypothetical protein
VPPGLLDTDITTVWNPGILADTLLNQPLGPNGLPVRTTVCATLTPGQASTLQSTLDGCASGSVVELQAGTYTVPATINVPSGVVLRGAGSSGSGATIVALASGQVGPVLAIGPGTTYDQACYQDSYATAVPLTADAKKETTTVSVAAGSSSAFAAGDLALIDQSDDTAVVNEGDCLYFKRKPAWGVSERVEIASVSGGTLTLSTPLHWTFQTSQTAQISKVSTPITRWAGVEHLRVQGGNGVDQYDGQKAGGIDVSNAAYSWIEDVQTDGTLTGMHVTLTGAYRCVVRDSHFHNSALYGFGVDNYGIVTRCGAADNLIENNIARYMDKPILFNNSGGGNVVGYNYADNEWSIDTQGDDACQEVTIDCHCSFPHMELLEGNYAPHMGASNTHGNAGYLTYFRNYASSQLSPTPIVWSQSDVTQTCSVTSLQFDGPSSAYPGAGDNHMTAVGNVLGSTADAALGVPVSLGTATASQTYEGYDGTGNATIFLLGGASDLSLTTLWWQSNFDTVNKKVMVNPAVTTTVLPASLYRATRPAWWPAGTPWPWAGSDLTPMVGKLPAQVASAAFDYVTAEDPSCTSSVANYDCCLATGAACVSGTACCNGTCQASGKCN